ncbi:MAG: glutamate formimidoyltransferase [Candidatus Dormibacteria bacterium]
MRPSGPARDGCTSADPGQEALLECVPNFSEGRDQGLILELCRVVAATTGVHLLDRHSDPDHNRTVLTFAGAPGRVLRAAEAAAAIAVAGIDLRRQRGVHPRMGAVDVIPLVPIRGLSLDDCAALARELGARLGRSLKIPVFLYGAAAAPGRPADLHVLRGRGFEQLRAGWAGAPRPDFGPRRLHPGAGAVAVGAREPLVAFNLELAGITLPELHAVARRLRTSGGGLPALQALAFPLERGTVQLSMNLLDHRVTGLAEVISATRSLIEGSGASIVAAELVGLLPAAALQGLADDPIPGLPGDGQTIETRLRQALDR